MSFDVCLTGKRLLVPSFPSKSHNSQGSTTQPQAAAFDSAMYDVCIKDNPVAISSSKHSNTQSAGSNMPSVTRHACCAPMHTELQANSLHTAFLALLCFLWVVLNMLLPEDTQQQSVAVLFSVSVLVLTPGLALAVFVQRCISAISILSLAITPWVLSPHRCSGFTIGMVFIFLWHSVYVQFSKLKHWQVSLTVVCLFSAFVSQCISYIAAPLHLGLVFDVSTILTLCMVTYVIYH